MKTVRYLLLVLVIFLIGGVMYKNVLPRMFSQQHPLVENQIDLSGKYDSTDQQGMWQGMPVLSYPVPEPRYLANVLGEASNKRIEVDLTNQRVYAYEGDNKVFDFLISSGKWGRTPTGTFRIWIKLRYSKMSGGSTALNTYYYLPNVPYVMYFSNAQIPSWRGFSLHGTYWHSNFGHPMSHGCVNMRTEDVEKLYYWAMPDLRGKNSIHATPDNPGTPIIIYGEAPWS